ncbi:MAG: phospholipase D-like domain-containing protein [Myxococcales bacterium]|nr:phospholipase D-like domain-containing protein [Myxococcales bacterium]
MKRVGALRDPPAPVRVGNRVRLLHDGKECFPAMLEAIASARHEVLLEMYWFASDQTGWRFARALMDAARRGVRVLVVRDAVGSLGSDGAMWRQMTEAGCDTREFGPIWPWARRFRLDRLQRRDHRKLLVVDGRIGMTGGVNIGDEWAPEEEGGGGWRDDMVLVEGPAVAVMRRLFMHTWRKLGGVEPSPPPVEHRDETAEGATCAVQVLANFWRGERRAIRAAYLARIAAARRYLWIANSYFVPDGQVRRALGRAAARGVDVRVLVPGRSDVAAVQWAGRALYGELLERGVQIHEWHPNVLHCKNAVIDDVWCTVGTYNLDYRSWRLNLEVNVAVEDEAVARRLRERMERDLDEAMPIRLEDWRFRPLGDRLLERFFHAFRKLL